MNNKQYFLTLFFTLTLTELSYYFGSGEMLDIGTAILIALIFIVGGLFVNWHLKQIEKGVDVNH